MIRISVWHGMGANFTLYKCNVHFEPERLDGSSSEMNEFHQWKVDKIPLSSLHLVHYEMAYFHLHIGVVSWSTTWPTTCHSFSVDDWQLHTGNFFPVLGISREWSEYQLLLLLLLPLHCYSSLLLLILITTDQFEGLRNGV
ncbi:hypothetical protein MRB53_001339 [Persea americana]|uniref:Uncharacterized protein n=1 Tax=Persea americana TaxID=3435 RepID=A0ACC2MRJ1_PERAE|nr:hypothetical protein MRB53_001339 [Persea americana]